ncbi:hypothetical protein BQ8420_03445 [Nocardiopsis sp. JB363]|nr:hypothetical protein BQ8420_03445 [Nocardiopsis sp. JB363]
MGAEPGEESGGPACTSGVGHVSGSCPWWAGLRGCSGLECAEWSMGCSSWVYERYRPCGGGRMRVS